MTRVGKGWGKPALLSERATLNRLVFVARLNRFVWSPDGEYLMTGDTTAFYVFRANAANSSPKYTMPRDSSINNADMTWAADSRGIFEAGRHKTLGFGVWHHPLGSSQSRLVLRADDPPSALMRSKPPVPVSTSRATAGKATSGPPT